MLILPDLSGEHTTFHHAMASCVSPDPRPRMTRCAPRSASALLQRTEISTLPARAMRRVAFGYGFGDAHAFRRPTPYFALARPAGLMTIRRAERIKEELWSECLGYWPAVFGIETLCSPKFLHCGAI
jgi:hypothetical protein